MSNDMQTSRRWIKSDLFFLAGLAVFKILIHLPVLHRYGYHHDEFYFIACGNHPAFGYVDHPPLVPWLAWLSTNIFGDSVFGLRILAALSTALSVFMVGLLVKRLGGGRFAQLAAALGMIVAPVYLRSGNMLCLPAFEPLFWILGSYVLVRIIQEDNPRLWLWLGLVTGLGLLNKHSMLFFGFGLVIGLLATPMRKYFKSPWLYAGGGIAFLIILPNLIWQMNHDWPTLNFILNLNEGVMSGISALQFILGQFLYLNPLAAFLWISGLVFLFRKSGKNYQVLGWIWLAVFVLLLVTKSKIYYLAPAYAALIAAGGLALEVWIKKKRKKWLKHAFIILLLAGGILMAPLSLPYLSIEATESFVNVITFGQLKNIHELTRDLRGMFGWRERVKIVADVYNRLSPEEKKKTIIWAFGYGNAGAIDFLGSRYQLPKVVSLNLSYWLWGVPEGEWDTILVIGVGKDSIQHIFRKVEEAVNLRISKTLHHFRVLVCRGPVKPLREIWPRNRPW